MAEKMKIGDGSEVSVGVITYLTKLTPHSQSRYDAPVFQSAGKMCAPERDWSPMLYQYLPMKLDSFFNYLNGGKINLIPPFQRGRVWNLNARKKLIQNIIKKRPIPAIFLYRESSESGETFSYNILDGKQRLESLMLFVGNERSTLAVKNINHYFYKPKAADQANFKVELNGKMQGLVDLEPALFRELQEYVIPTIEILLDESTGIDEIISLFVDINSYGVQVKRFDIVKAMSEDKLLKSAFGLISLKQKRKNDIFYRAKKNEFTTVLKNLQVVDKIVEPNAKVDRMWELMVELTLFLRTKKHRTPVDILKNFIKVGQTDTKEPKPTHSAITANEILELRKAFGFLVAAYKHGELKLSKLATNQIYFYTMITGIIAGDLFNKYSDSVLTKKLVMFGQMIDGKLRPEGAIAPIIKEYQDLSGKHTTHPGRRVDRQEKFLRAVDLISVAGATL